MKQQCFCAIFAPVFFVLSLNAMSRDEKPLSYVYDGAEKSAEQHGRALFALAGANPHLRTLCLTHMRLCCFPPFIKQFKHLRSLTLADNAFDEAAAPVIGAFKKLRYLDISRNRFTKLTPEIMRLSQLRELRAAENRIVEIEEGWRHLTHLCSLDLLANDLGKLDDSLGDLRKLESVYLDANEFEKFPACLKKLPMLTLLTLTHNRFKSRPVELAHLSAGAVEVDPTDAQREALEHRQFGGVVVYYDHESQRCKNPNAG